MDAKKIIKRILPIIIALAVIAVIAIVATVATRDKKNPVISNADDAYVTYTYTDNNGSSKTITIAREKVFETLTGSDSAISATLAEMVDSIDVAILADKKNGEGKSYLDAVSAEDVYVKIEKAIWGDDLECLLEDNKEDYTLEAKKANKSYADYVKEELQEGINDFVDTLNISYGIEAKAEDFTLAENDGEFTFTVSNTCGAFEYYKIAVARFDYARDIVAKEYEESLVNYTKYLADKEEYDRYLADKEKYEDAKEDYKKASKSDKKVIEDPGKSFEKSKYYAGDYTVTSEPEVVSAPVLVEDDFKSIYTNDNQDAYWTVMIPYETKAEAETALLQHGVIVATNSDGDYTWFHYGDLANVTDEGQKEELKKYACKGLTTIISDNAYYKTIADATKESPANTGAYELSESEIKALIVELYNQVYQANDEKKLVEGTDYSVSEGVYTFEKTDKIKLTKSDLQNKSLYSETSTNRFYKFKVDGENEFRDTYTYQIVSGAKFYIYLIVSKEVVKTWDEVKKDASDDYTKTAVYTENLEEKLDSKTTTTIINTKMAALRLEYDLKIYDTRLEDAYMNAYTSDYKAVKKASKKAVASYELSGSKKEVLVDDLFATLSDKYGVVTVIDTYQIEWMFREAMITDVDGNNVLVNKYIDYDKYLEKGKIKAAKKDTDDKEVKDFFENLELYVENTKNNFASGSYESYGFGPDYGWTNFLKDYFGTYYGFTVNNAEDLKLFYIYQQIVTDYCDWLAEIDEETWNNVYLASMAQQLSNAFTLTGEHLLISYKDEDGNMVDPAYWTAEQVALAKELYDAVLTLVKTVPTVDIATELQNLVDAFNNAPYTKADGSEPKITYKSSSADGESFDVDYISYNYEYNKLGKKVIIDVSKYKSAGISLTTEALTVTKGTMVSEFEDACKMIWDSMWDDLLDGESVSKTVIFDKTFTAPEYNSYGKDLEATATSNEGYLVTQFGYHVYINETASLASYFTTVDSEKVFIGFPEREYALLYVYNNENKALDDFVSFSDLYDAYTAENSDANKQAIIDAAKSELKYNVTDFDKFFALLDNYYGAKKNYVASQLSTWFGNYSSNAYTLIYGDFTGSSYYQLKVIEAILANLNGFNLTETQKASFTKIINNYIESYYSGLKYVSFTYGDKEAVKGLLESIAFLSDYDVYTKKADIMFVEGYDTEKATITKAFEALKNYAETSYKALSEDEKAELADLFSDAGLDK